MNLFLQESFVGCLEWMIKSVLFFLSLSVYGYNV